MFSFHSHYFNKLPVTFFCPKSLSQPLFIRTNPFLPPASVNKHWISHIIISEPRYVPNQSRWQFCSCKYSTNLLNEHTLLRSNVSGHVPFYRPAASEHRPPPPPACQITKVDCGLHQSCTALFSIQSILVSKGYSLIYGTLHAQTMYFLHEDLRHSTHNSGKCYLLMTTTITYHNVDGNHCRHWITFFFFLFSKALK